MGMLTISIISAVFVVIIAIMLVILIYYNIQAHQCDGDLLFWCYSDWKCLYGINDPLGDRISVYTDIYNKDGTKKDVNLETEIDASKMPLKCYTLGMFSMMKLDPECAGIAKEDSTSNFLKYQKSSYDKCTKQDDPCALDGGGVDDVIYPCGKKLTDGTYGEKMNASTGFYLPPSSDAGSINFNTIGMKGCEGQTAANCITFPKFFQKVLGPQIDPDLACKPE